MSEHSPFRVEFAQRAVKDAQTLTARQRTKLADIVRNRIAVDPYSGKRLVGDLKGLWSVRFTLKDRIVYRIDEKLRVIFILRVRTHYSP